MKAWVVVSLGVPASSTTDEPTAIRWRKSGLDVREFRPADEATECAARCDRLEAALQRLRGDFADVPLNAAGRAMWQWIDGGMIGDPPSRPQ